MYAHCPLHIYNKPFLNADSEKNETLSNAIRASVLICARINKVNNTATSQPYRYGSYGVILPLLMLMLYNVLSTKRVFVWIWSWVAFVWRRANSSSQKFCKNSLYANGCDENDCSVDNDDEKKLPFKYAQYINVAMWFFRLLVSSHSLHLN